MTLEQLGIIDPIIRILKAEGYKGFTPLQEQIITTALNGKDVVATALPGVERTTAYALPILQLLFGAETPLKGRKPIKALIVTPTRETALQVGGVFASYSRNAGLRHTVIYGDVPQNAQVDALKRGVDILIATPDRLLELMSQKHVLLRYIQVFVLDDADNVSSTVLKNELSKIAEQLPAKEKRQALFFTSSMSDDIEKLAEKILKEPVKVADEMETMQVAVALVTKNRKASLKTSK